MRLMTPRVAMLAGLATAALAAALIALSTLAAGPSAASGDSASDSGRVVSAATDPVLLELQKRNPALALDTAREVLSTETSTVWLIDASNGDLCLIERVRDIQSDVGARFSCKSREDAAREGLLGGVPGHFYAVPAAGVGSVTAKVAGKPVGVPMTKDAFWVPAAATEVTLGESPIELPVR